MYRRTGTCARCGECCGYPRATDGGQNNPWPADWPQSIRTWTIEAIDQYLPVFKVPGHPDLGGKQYGSLKIGKYTIRWIWVPGAGICTDTPAYGDPASYDIRCPLLSGKVCAIKDHATLGRIWTVLCEPVPPSVFETAEQVQNWQTNCPSCSYTWVFEE